MNLQKPEPYRKVKARRDRAEAKVKKVVREACVARDGYCRLAMIATVWAFGSCDGPSEWNHLKKRSLTRGQAPEIRHNTATSIMNCKSHHGMIDDGKIRHEYKTENGADGPMRFEFDGVVYEEEAA